MALLIIGLLLFLGIHSISIFALDFRNRQIEKNHLAWKAGYSIIALIGFFLIVQGYAQAKLEPTLLYVTPPWLGHVSALLMLPVFILFIAPYFPGKIRAVTKHPQLIAVKLWAVSHLLVNGMLADVVLFGAFLTWAVVDRISMKTRSTQPAHHLPRSTVNDVIIVVLGLGFYGIFAMYLHQRLIGIPPFIMS